MGAVVIYAPNVGGGGGLVLVRELLGAVSHMSRVTAVLDRRGQAQIGDQADGIDVRWVDSSIIGRWRAEKLLSRLTGPDDLVLCFHNLPPILPTKGRVFCYVQNANLVGIIPTSHLSGWLRVRYALERFIARTFRHRVHRYLVQTPTMAAALCEWYGANPPPIHVLPFAPTESQPESHSKHRVAPGDCDVARPSPRWDYIYVSDGYFHKNHQRLFVAWQLLAERGVRPSLALTLHPGRDGGLRERVRELAEEGLNIEDLGQLLHADVLAAYRRSRALIFPSYAEAFGIPLLEAKAAGLPILAPELDYVRDVCEPAVTFDPFSSRSIARAVLRFQKEPADSVTPMSADAMAATLCELNARSEPSSRFPPMAAESSNCA